MLSPDPTILEAQNKQNGCATGHLAAGEPEHYVTRSSSIFNNHKQQEFPPRMESYSRD